MMTVPSKDLNNPIPDLSWSQQKALLQGEILLETRPHSSWGGAVTAKMHVPIVRSSVWQQVTDYPRWVQYFPDLIKSEVLHQDNVKRVYQVAQKSFVFITAQVEIYLNVFEVEGQHIQFRLEKGTFTDFMADLKLQDFSNGTLLTYSVKATPNIPIPSVFVQQGMNLELPRNLKQMRQVLCAV